jgi:hypothetical protein
LEWCRIKRTWHIGMGKAGSSSLPGFVCSSEIISVVLTRLRVVERIVTSYMSQQPIRKEDHNQHMNTSTNVFRQKNTWHVPLTTDDMLRTAVMEDVVCVATVRYWYKKFQTKATLAKQLKIQDKSRAEASLLLLATTKISQIVTANLGIVMARDLPKS